jgi:hypothetical protein
MKFIFNDILSADSNLYKGEDKLESVILSSNLIFEKSIRTAQLSKADFDAALNDYLTGGPEERRDVLNNEYPKMDEDQKKDFLEKINPKKNGPSGNFGLGNEQSLIEKAVSKTMEFGEVTGEAAEKASAKDVNRNRIVSQLRSFLKGNLNMKEEQIGQFFDNIFKKGIPESELLEIANDALLYSAEAGTNLKTVLDFMINHYAFQNDLHLTREITKLAAEVRQQNPDINIFDMLSKSASGQIPDVAMVTLIDDPKMQSTVLSLLSLSQMRVIEQKEAVRREVQKARDNLQSIQERTNRQRALVDALKMIEVDKTLTDEINEFGRLFKQFMSDPTFRALRNVLYDISAARKLLDTWGTLAVDTQPITPRQTDVEMRGRPQAGSDITQQGKIDQRSLGRTTLNNNTNLKFVKVAQSKNFFSTEEQQEKYLEMINSFADVYTKLISEATRRNKRTAAVLFKLFLNNLIACKTNPALFANFSKKALEEFASYLQNAVKKRLFAQANPQNIRQPVVPDATATQSVDKLYKAGLDFLEKWGVAYEVSQGNIQAWSESSRLFGKINDDIQHQKVLNDGLQGLLAPTQLQPGLTRAFVANSEIETDNMLGLSKEESAVRFSLAKKRNAYKQALEDKKKIIENSRKMQVDLGQGSDGQTPLETPKKIRELYEDLAKWLKEVIVQVQYERDLLKRGFDRKLNEKDPARQLDPFALKTVQAKLAEIENDLKFFKNEYGRISSTTLIAEQMARKDRFEQLLGPVQKKLAMLAKAGFSPAGLMFNVNSTDAGGESHTYGNLLYSILNEEKKSLGVLLEAYEKARQSTSPVDLSSYLGAINSTPSGEVSIV